MVIFSHMISLQDDGHEDANTLTFGCCICHLLYMRADIQIMSSWRWPRWPSVSIFFFKKKKKTFRSWVTLVCSVIVFSKPSQVSWAAYINLYICTWIHFRCWRINLVNALTVISVLWGSNMHGRRESSECGRALIIKVKSLSRCRMLDSSTWQLP